MLIRFIFAPFLLWISNLLFDLTIIVSHKKIVLILELRTLMEGQYLFCVQEYRYCFASKNMMIHKYLVLTSNNTKQYIFVWKIFNLDFMINKPFYDLSPEILSIMTRQKKMLEEFIWFTTWGGRWRWDVGCGWHG